MKELSIKELIDSARGCAGDLVGNACVKCAFHSCTDDCTGALLLVLADKLEEGCAESGAVSVLVYIIPQTKDFHKIQK